MAFQKELRKARIRKEVRFSLLDEGSARNQELPGLPEILIVPKSGDSGGTNNLPPILFHQVHGDYIRISQDGTVATRVRSYYKGITFSSRPIKVAEKVCVKLLELSQISSGVFRFGFTCIDPRNLEYGLPKYLTDLTMKSGYWVEELEKKFMKQDTVIFYYVTQAGDVHFGINGEEKGVFLRGVVTRGPLWAIMDFYGISTAIELVDPQQQLNNSHRNLAIGGDTSPGDPAALKRLTRPSLTALTINQQPQSQRSAVDDATTNDMPGSMFQQPGNFFNPLPFHRTHGRNIRLSNDRCIASRTDTEFCHGYVFTTRPIKIGEKVVIQVLATQPMCRGTLAFGLTSCDPAMIQGADLPDNSDRLLYRPEYWMISKNVSNRPQQGDELSFCITHTGETQFSKNGRTPVVIMHVNQTLKLWAFFDLVGSTRKIRILGSCVEPHHPHTSSVPKSGDSGGTNNLPPILFHQVHGDNIRISRDGSVARRVKTYYKGITFSSRPIKVAEKVCVKFLEVSDVHSGVIVFGFSCNDPNNIRNGLPKYLTDLRRGNGYWVEVLKNRFMKQDTVLFYYVTQAGDVHFGINGEEKGVFIWGVETRGPLWAIIDIYGKSTVIELVDPQQQLNNSRRNLAIGSDTSPSEPVAMERLNLPSAADLTINQQNHQQPQSQRRAVDGATTNDMPGSRFQQPGNFFNPLPFHRTHGRNIRLTNDRCIASRTDTEFCNGYVFTTRPIQIGEQVVIQVLATQPSYFGALAFGLTSCDPAMIQGADLPDDSNLLLDWPEYWVISEDVAIYPQRGDEISFCITHTGGVQFSKNGSTPVVFMHVDQTLQLWAFFDVCGRTQKIRILGSCVDPHHPHTSSGSRFKKFNSANKNH